MSSSGLPEEVRALLRERSDGYDQLEILLLLPGEYPSQWQGASVSEQLQIAREAAEVALAVLESRSLLAAMKERDSVWYQYVARDAAIDRAITALARAYAGNRLAVMQAMN